MCIKFSFEGSAETKLKTANVLVHH